MCGRKPPTVPTQAEKGKLEDELLSNSVQKKKNTVGGLLQVSFVLLDVTSLCQTRS